jgi:TonB family protein
MILWLVGLAMSGSASQPVPLNRSAWISTDDYPAEAMRSFWDGPVGFLLNVSPQGLVSNCVVTQSSGHKVLDDATCDLLRSRASFSPATDDSGHPTQGTYSGRINWAIPDKTHIELIPSAGNIQFDVDDNGNVSNCKSTIPPGNWPNLNDLCGNFKASGDIPAFQFYPKVDAHGKLQRRHVVIHFDMQVKDSSHQ